MSKPMPTLLILIINGADHIAIQITEIILKSNGFTFFTNHTHIPPFTG